jgi:ABC transporter substrate binding protein
MPEPRLASARFSSISIASTAHAISGRFKLSSPRNNAYATRRRRLGRVRRIGVLMAVDENDPAAKAQLSRFTQGLSELGWSDGRNLRTVVRWAAGDVDRMRMFAKELVELKPDVILANTTPVVAALQRETRTIPIVFVIVSDPVGSGFVASLPRPGGNITGFGTRPGSYLEKDQGLCCNTWVKAQAVLSSCLLAGSQS